MNFDLFAYKFTMNLFQKQGGMYINNVGTTKNFLNIKNKLFEKLSDTFNINIEVYNHYGYLADIKNSFFVGLSGEYTNLLKGGFFHGLALPLNKVVQMAVLFLIMRSNLKSICL